MLGALGGAPVRGADYPAHPSLDQMLILPDAFRSDPIDDVAAAWSEIVGGAPVLLVRSVERGRELLLQAAVDLIRQPVRVPANATFSLIKALERQQIGFQFAALDEQLRIESDPTALTWAQPIGGIGGSSDQIGPLWIDCSDTVPQPGAIDPAADVTIYGLHLHTEADQAGALLVFGDHQLYTATAALVGSDDQPDLDRAAAQWQRLYGAGGIVPRQNAILSATWRGLCEAAGLPLLPQVAYGPLPHSIAVRIPDACDATTFTAYVKAEHTPARSISDVRPLYHEAARMVAGRTTADQIGRWLLVPVGPEWSDEEIRHAVLGVAKAADYLGVRWYTDHARAAWYARLMIERYGADHRAYRPVFALHHGE
jgi:hypothetical protein